MRFWFPSDCRTMLLMRLLLQKLVAVIVWFFFQNNTSSRHVGRRSLTVTRMSTSGRATRAANRSRRLQRNSCRSMARSRTSWTSTEAWLVSFHASFLSVVCAMLCINTFLVLVYFVVYIAHSHIFKSPAEQVIIYQPQEFLAEHISQFISNQWFIYKIVLIFAFFQLLCSWICCCYCI